ncbi:MAG: hypothetical protein ACE5E7_04745 [Anaerolineae bacterium]
MSTKTKFALVVVFLVTLIGLVAFTAFAMNVNVYAGVMNLLELAGRVVGSGTTV